MTTIIKTINAMITLIPKTRTARTKCPMRKKMITSMINSSKRATRPCIMNSHLHWVGTPCPEKGVTLVQGLLLALVPALALAWAAATGSMPTIMWLTMTASWANPPNTSTHTPLRTTTINVSIIPTRAILFLPPSPLQKQIRVSVLPNRESCQQSKIYVSHLVYLFQIGN